MSTVHANVQSHINDQVLWEVAVIQMTVTAVSQGGQEVAGMVPMPLCASDFEKKRWRSDVFC